MSEKKVEENEGDPLVHGVKVEEDREDFQQSVTSHSEQQNLLKEDEKTMENFENIKIETIEDTRRVFPDTEESGTSSFNKKDDATTPASPVSSEKKLNPVPVDSSQPMSASSAEPTTFWMNFTEPSPKTGNLQSETFPQRHVPEPTYHTVINMPREAPVPRSRRQFPGPSNLYLEGPLLDTRNLVTPTHLPIGPPSYVPGMPYYQPRLLPDYNCTSQQDPCMGLDNGSSQNPTTSDRLNQEDVWDTDSNNANISPEDENFNIFNW